MKTFAPFALAVGLTITLGTVARADDTPPTAKPATITISKETTHLTEPIVDGRIDFLGALNARLSKGVTPENNAAVLFVRAVGPGEISPKIRAKYLALLEVGPLPDQGNYLVPLEGQALLDEYKKAGNGPWSRNDYPLLAKWVDGNGDPLGLAIEGTERSQFFTPLVGAGDSKPMLIAVLLPMMQQTRGIARALQARARLRIDEGDLKGAQSDLLACHRLARLISRHPTLIGLLVAYAVENIAASADATLAEAPGFTATLALAYRDQLHALPPMNRTADSLNTCERFMFIDCVSALAAGDVSLDDLSGIPSSGITIDRDAVNLIANSFIDWNVILKDGNRFYDRIVAAARTPDYAERKTKTDALMAELKATAVSNADVASTVLSLLTPKQSLTNRMSDTFIALLCPALGAALAAEDRNQMTMQLTELSLALAAYRAENSSYPASLQDLTPEFASKIPNDLFTSTALVYKRDGTGYTLYSVGVNQKDDGGREQPQGDDLVVQATGR